jgi:hypothetical protein
VNKGQSWTPQECNDWKLRKFQEISAAGKPQDPGYCKTTCIYSAQYSFNDYGCCCVDWNQLPCQDCPCTEGKNCPPKCPLTPECLATL